jgi:hypothetical protein
MWTVEGIGVVAGKVSGQVEGIWLPVLPLQSSAYV